MDDSAQSLRLLETLLAGAGYEVRPASSGRLALRSAQAIPPALIMLDVRMPHMDGYEVCRRLKADERTRAVPIIFISILEDEGDKVRAFQAGAVDYVSKPFRAEEVLARVQTHLSLRRAQLHLEHRNRELQAAQETLEEKVEERTAELGKVVADLKAQMVERRRVEEALRQERRLFVGGPTVVFQRTVSPGWPVEYVSPNVAGVLGYRLEAFEKGGVRYQSLVHPDDLQRVIKALEGAGASSELEYRIAHADGDFRWVSDFTVLVRNEHQEVVRYHSYVLDMTERKRTDREREALLQAERLARTEAVRAGQAKEQFFAALSHELRTPLSAILGWASLLGKRGAGDPDYVGRGLEAIARNARAQAKLVDDLLDMERVTSGRVRLDLQPMSLVSVIDAAVDSAKPSASAKGIRIEQSVDRSLGTSLGDASRLAQVMGNLLSNAIKFTPAEGRVHVEAKRRGSDVFVQVSDTGIGITSKTLPHIFERYWHAEPSTTQRHGGLGLGLAIVRHLVELHGGKIEVTSPGSGKGTTATVLLPWTPSPAKSAARTPASAALEATGDSSLAGIRVLVVDDDPDARELIRSVLVEREAQVDLAGSAQEAMEELRRHVPCVLVSDIRMPDEDGYALIQKVRALPVARGGDVPALALTAFARSEDHYRALRAGFQSHMPKPFDPVRLVASVAEIARRS